MTQRLKAAATLALALSACAPEIPSNPAPGARVTARFAPPAVVPTPNDLAIDAETGLVNAPVNPATSLAEQEFTRDYLNTLDGFPTSSTAVVTFSGALDPASVNGSVRVLDASNALASVTGATVTYVAPAEEGGIATVKVMPPATGWAPGHKYVVALIGGQSGLKDEGGEPVLGSNVWALIRSASPLVECPNNDLASSDCRVVPSVIPAVSTDVYGRAAEQLAAAKQLEKLRQGYKPLLDALAAGGAAREDVALLWTFTATTMSEATFDLVSRVIPFPNSLATNPATGKVLLPCPANDLSCATAPTTLAGKLTQGLNTLDGFSTTAPLVSENSVTRGALSVGELDPDSLQLGTGVLNLTLGGTQPAVNACLNCVATAVEPQELQFVPMYPLEEKSTYLAYMTRELKNTDAQGVIASPMFAFVRSSAPLVDGSGKSLVSSLSDAQAAQLEPVRLAFKPAIDELVLTMGIERKDLAQAWVFRTQSTVSVLKTLAGVPTGLGLAGALPATASGVAVDAQLTGFFAATFQAANRVAAAYTGTIRIPMLLTGPGGTLNPTAPAFESIPFILTIPAGTAPTDGWPVTIFGHGLTGSRGNMLAIANTLATVGHATIAIDTNKHGARSDCRLSGGKVPTVATDNDACATGTCSASGACMVDATTPGSFRMKPGDSFTPIISGWNIIDAQNLFATRDNFRQQVLDLSQVERVLRATGAESLDAQIEPLDGTPKLDGIRITYVGQSLGGILGSLYVAASPNVGHAVLNVPGGDPVGILETAPAFEAQFDAVKAMLEGQLMPEGSPAYDSFLRTARWIMDPADPRNAASAMLNHRNVLIQYITGDIVVPNGTTEGLVTSSNEAPGIERMVDVFTFDPPIGTGTNERPLCGRHAFLLQPASSGTCAFNDPTSTGMAQLQVANYLTCGAISCP